MHPEIASRTIKHQSNPDYYNLMGYESAFLNTHAPSPYHTKIIEN